MDVTARADGVLLKWKVADTTDANGYFSVEHSFDGSFFEPIDSVPIMGLEYFYFNRNPRHGWPFYRIRYHDHNGYTTTSPIKRSHTNAEHVTIYPNPASGHAYITVYSKAKGEIRVRLLDMSLKEITSQVHQAERGITVLRIQLLSVPRGVYMVQVGTFSEQVMKLVVQ